MGNVVFVLGLGLEGNISLRIVGVASDRNDIITVYSVRLAVVRHGAGVALDGDGDLVGDLNGLPLCIEVIAAFLIRTSIVAFFELDLLLTRLGAPADELVISAARETKRLIISNSKFPIVGHGIGCLGDIRTKVAVISDFNYFGLITVNGVKGHVAGDLDAAVGVILDFCAVFISCPAEEDLVGRGGVRAIENGCKCALSILAGVGDKI